MLLLKLVILPKDRFFDYFRYHGYHIPDINVSILSLTLTLSYRLGFGLSLMRLRVWTISFTWGGGISAEKKNIYIV